MYNSLITNFVTKKNWIMRSTFKVLFYVNGEKRYCPDYGASYNQWFCGSIQLQTDHCKNNVGCKG